MRLKFSLALMLLATGYTAIVCAAFTQGSYVYAELLWMMTVLAACYALLAVCFYRGSRRAVAVGFVVCWMAYVICLEVVPHRMPSRRVFTLAGYPEPSTPERSDSYRRLIRGLDADSRQNDPQNRARYDSLYKQYRMALGERPEIAASNAVGAMLAGMLGAVLGSIVYSRRNCDCNLVT